MIKRVTKLLAAAVFASLLSLAAVAGSLRVIDSAGREVVLDKPASRIIALAPHIVENIFSAGAGTKLVGAVSYSNYPPQAANIPIVGGYHAFSLEKIVSLQPHLIVTWAEGNGEEVAQPFQALGIPVYIDEPRKLEDVAHAVRNIGVLSGTEAEANTAAEQFLRRLSSLQARYKNADTVTVFYQVWNKPLQTINENHIISSVIELCGGRNIFTDTPVIAPKISLEAVITRNPEVIVASGMDEERPEWLDEWRQYSQLNAVASNNLYFIPPDILQRHTFRILQGAEMMCQSLANARNKRKNNATLLAK